MYKKKARFNPCLLSYTGEIRFIKKEIVQNKKLKVVTAIVDMLIFCLLVFAKHKQDIMLEMRQTKKLVVKRSKKPILK